MSLQLCLWFHVRFDFFSVSAFPWVRSMLQEEYVTSHGETLELQMLEGLISEDRTYKAIL